MVISHDDEQRGESADTPTYPSMLSVRETSTNRGGELDGMARVSRASLALREVSGKRSSIPVPRSPTDPQQKPLSLPQTK